MTSIPAERPVHRTSRAGILPIVELDAAIADGDYISALELAESGASYSPESRSAAFERELAAYDRVLEAERAGIELQRADPAAWEVSRFYHDELAALEEHMGWQAVVSVLDRDPLRTPPIDSRGLRRWRADRVRHPSHPRRTPSLRLPSVAPARRADRRPRPRVGHRARRARSPGRSTDGDPEPDLARCVTRAGLS